MQNVLYITVGLPRSGKSTWAMKQGIPVVNPDSVRLALHGQAYIKEAEQFVWAITHKMVEALFLAGHTEVILDATIVTRKARDAWKSEKWVRRFVIMPMQDPAICLQIAADGFRPDLVPVIDRMVQQFESINVNEELGEDEHWHWAG